jgi:magnesium chelatase family protein
LLRSAGARMALSARAHHRVMKVALTIADLAGAEGVRDNHVGEALAFRATEGRKA